MLCKNKKLAMTSSKPGKTRLVNHFLINRQWYLVDLPGYGYAKMSATGKQKLEQVIRNYINLSEEMVMLFVLIDSRHKPQKIDLEFIEWLGENGIPFSIVFTKADKLSKLRLNENVETYKNILLESWEELPPIFVTSSEKKIGGEQLTAYIEQINEQLD
jgi:GTP-binding protein